MLNWDITNFEFVVFLQFDCPTVGPIMYQNLIITSHAPHTVYVYAILMRNLITLLAPTDNIK